MSTEKQSGDGVQRVVDGFIMPHNNRSVSSWIPNDSHLQISREYIIVSKIIHLNLCRVLSTVPIVHPVDCHLWVMDNREASNVEQYG